MHGSQPFSNPLTHNINTLLTSVTQELITTWTQRYVKYMVPIPNIQVKLSCLLIYVHSCYDINRYYITLTSGPMAHAISWKILFLCKILLKDNPIMANKNLPAWVQNLMCFTPTVIMWSGTAGFHCSMKILSLCPLVSASLAPFRQSQTTMQWSSSSPTDASFFPSPSNKNNND